MDSGTSNHGSPAKRQKLAPRAHELGVMRKSTDNGSASFLGSSSGIHFIRVVYNAFARRSAHLSQPQQASKDTQVPGEDDQLHHQHHQYRPELWLPHELDFQETSTALPFEALVRWTRGYFENWNPMFPFLSGPAFLVILEHISQAGFSDLSAADGVLVRSIVSISLMDRRQANFPGPSTPVPSTLVFRSVHQAMESLHTLFCEPPTISILQAAFGVQLFLTSLLRLNAASRVGGIIIRTTFHLGLHRCPVRFSCFNSLEIATRRRLFWSVYCLERYLSQALGIPLGIRDDDIDVCYPNSEVHGLADEDHRIRLLGHLAKFARVRGRIIELRNKSILHREDSIDATQVHGELTHWWNEVYDDVHRIQHDNDTTSPTAIKPFHRLLLVVLRHEAIISMNRPLLAAEAPSPEYRTALQICIESSRSILTTLQQYLSDSFDFSVPLVWPSFTWAVWMSCLILVYAAWEGEFPASSASRYAKTGLSILQNLSRRGNTWPQTCIEAVRDLDSALTTPEQATPMYPSIVDNDKGNKGPTTTSDTLDTGISLEYHQQTPSTPGEGLLSNPLAAAAASNQWSNSSIIFGNQAIDNLGVASGFRMGLGFPEFSIGGDGEEGLGIGDLWSLADGPWLIHENYGLTENVQYYSIL
ncbi:fungal-specific transcription factor domain-containing protein [Aspergillus cavernicola]|uniref:Fungal-specific transcription factor domain-containing protein n=1 Tax=Aspergillus cavernicola TaxID=176166 RepID=A0ABR4ITQ5_9EURO